jgi:hypothetical protein
MIKIKNNIDTKSIEIELNKEFKSRSGYLYSLALEKRIEYDEITEEEIDFIIGPFVKVFAKGEKIKIYSDLMGEGLCLIKVLNNEIIIYESIGEALANNAKISQEILKKVYESEGFVKSEFTILENIYKTAAFAHIQIDVIKNKIEFLATKSVVFKYLESKTDQELFNILKKICSQSQENSTLLYSGGLDSKLINKLSSQKYQLEYFNYDLEYEPNNYDERIIENEIKNGTKVKITKASLVEVEKYLSGPEYKKALESLLGYDHQAYGFDLIFKNIKNKLIISGQNADTVAFFGPSNRLRIQNYRLRNVRSFIARLKLIKFITSKSMNLSHYFAIYNDNKYLFNNTKIIKKEEKFINEFLEKNTNYINKWYFLIVAKMRSFGGGADINAQRLLAIQNGKNIIFPLNNLVFSEISRRFFMRKPIYYLIEPKNWYYFFISKKISLQNYIPPGYRDYKKTTIYTRYAKEKKIFLEQLYMK